MNNSEREYLSNKHRGGESSRNGNLYENYYAVFSILREMSEGHCDAIISSQVEGAYVDDLLIVDDRYKIYHQLKNQEKLSWGRMQHGDLMYDFMMQASLCEECSENFSLKLVTAHRLESLVKQLPDELKEVASVEYYPMLEDFNRYAYYPAFASVAMRAIGCEPCEIDKIENIATVLLGLWTGGMCQGLKVKEMWAKMRRVLVGEEIFDSTMADELCALLARMGFSIQMEHCVLNWKWGGFAGSLALNNPKMKSLLSLGGVEDMIQNLI